MTCVGVTSNWNSLQGRVRLCDRQEKVHKWRDATKNDSRGGQSEQWEWIANDDVNNVGGCEMVVKMRLSIAFV
jgi:hypothetical protein